MTTFWRNGFWRTSVNGVLHWDEGHNVDRDQWERDSGGSAYFEGLLRDSRVGQSVSSTFVNPNAECPVCGASVFFYQNAAGGRVFFDELGPPWPKHPCTDNAAVRAQSQYSPAERLFPHARGNSETESIQRWLGLAGLSPLEAFQSKYALAPWSPYSLEGVLRNGRHKVLALRRLNHPNSEIKRQLLQIKRRLNGVANGDILFYFRGWLSYFDVEQLLPVEVECTRLAGASTAIAVLLGCGPSAMPSSARDLKR